MSDTLQIGRDNSRLYESSMGYPPIELVPGLPPLVDGQAFTEAEEIIANLDSSRTGQASRAAFSSTVNYIKGIVTNPVGFARSMALSNPLTNFYKTKVAEYEKENQGDEKSSLSKFFTQMNSGGLRGMLSNYTKLTGNTVMAAAQIGTMLPTPLQPFFLGVLTLSAGSQVIVGARNILRDPELRNLHGVSTFTLGTVIGSALNTLPIPMPLNMIAYGIAGTLATDLSITLRYGTNQLTPEQTLVVAKHRSAFGAGMALARVSQRQEMIKAGIDDLLDVTKPALSGVLDVARSTASSVIDSGLHAVSDLVASADNTGGNGNDDLGMSKTSGELDVDLADGTHREGSSSVFGLEDQSDADGGIKSDLDSDSRSGDNNTSPQRRYPGNGNSISRPKTNTADANLQAVMGNTSADTADPHFSALTAPDTPPSMPQQEGGGTSIYDDLPTDYDTRMATWASGIPEREAYVNAFETIYNNKQSLGFAATGTNASDIDTMEKLAYEYVRQNYDEINGGGDTTVDLADIKALDGLDSDNDSTITLAEVNNATNSVVNRYTGAEKVMEAYWEGKKLEAAEQVFFDVEQPTHAEITAAIRGTNDSDGNWSGGLDETQTTNLVDAIVANRDYLNEFLPEDLKYVDDDTLRNMLLASNPATLDSSGQTRTTSYLATFLETYMQDPDNRLYDSSADSAVDFRRFFVNDSGDASTASLGALMNKLGGSEKASFTPADTSHLPRVVDLEGGRDSLQAVKFGNTQFYQSQGQAGHFNNTTTSEALTILYNVDGQPAALLDSNNEIHVFDKVVAASGDALQTVTATTRDGGVYSLEFVTRKSPGGKSFVQLKEASFEADGDGVAASETIWQNPSLHSAPDASPAADAPAGAQPAAPPAAGGDGGAPADTAAGSSPGTLPSGYTEVIDTSGTLAEYTKTQDGLIIHFAADAFDDETFNSSEITQVTDAGGNEVELQDLNGAWGGASQGYVTSDGKIFQITNATSDPTLIQVGIRASINGTPIDFRNGSDGVLMTLYDNKAFYTDASSLENDQILTSDEVTRIADKGIDYSKHAGSADFKQISSTPNALNRAITLLSDFSTNTEYDYNDGDDKLIRAVEITSTSSGDKIYYINNYVFLDQGNEDAVLNPLQPSTPTEESNVVDGNIYVSVDTSGAQTVIYVKNDTVNPLTVNEDGNYTIDGQTITIGDDSTSYTVTAPAPADTPADTPAEVEGETPAEGDEGAGGDEEGGAAGAAGAEVTVSSNSEESYNVDTSNGSSFIVDKNIFGDDVTSQQTENRIRWIVANINYAGADAINTEDEFTQVVRLGNQAGIDWDNIQNSHISRDSEWYEVLNIVNDKGGDYTLQDLYEFYYQVQNPDRQSLARALDQMDVRRGYLESIFPNLGGLYGGWSGRTHEEIADELIKLSAENSNLASDPAEILEALKIQRSYFGDVVTEGRIKDTIALAAVLVLSIAGLNQARKIPAAYWRLKKGTPEERGSGYRVPTIPTE